MTTVHHDKQSKSLPSSKQVLSACDMIMVDHGALGARQNIFDDVAPSFFPPSASPLPSSSLHHHSSFRILRLPEVMNRVGLCRASIYQHMHEGAFPKQITLGVRAVGWLEHEVAAWLMTRVHARHETKAFKRSNETEN